MDALLLIFTLGVVTLALGVDVGMLLAYLGRRWH
jgi:hypothetical protein